jgi:hypothetical protein
MDLRLGEPEGVGVDRSQLRERLSLPPAERLAAAVGGARNVTALVRRAQASA